MKTLDTVSGISGAWPDATAVNDPVQGVGTNLEASWLADLFGFFQATLYQAGNVAPSGSVETKTTSQMLECLYLLCGVPGEIVGFPALTLPTGSRLLKLEGQCVTVASYPRLLNVYCSDPENPTAASYYRCTDPLNPSTSRNTAGAYLKLPDYRGLFLRGRDALNTHDPEGSGRYFGDVQTESIAQHNHDGIRVGAGSSLKLETGGGADSVIDFVAAASGSTISTTSTGTGIGSSAATNETRPDNSTVTWCIRF